MHRLVLLNDDVFRNGAFESHVACVRVNGDSWNNKDRVDIFIRNGQILAKQNIPQPTPKGVSQSEYGLSLYSQHMWTEKEITVVNKILNAATSMDLYLREDNPNVNVLHTLSKAGRYALCFKIARADLIAHLTQIGSWELSSGPTGNNPHHYSIYPNVNIPVASNLQSTSIMSASYLHIPELNNLPWEQCGLVLMAAADIFLDDGLDDFGKKVIEALEKPGEGIYNHEDILDQILNFRQFTLNEMPSLVNHDLASYLRGLVSGML